MVREIATRLHWVLMYHEAGNAGLVCARYGISRPTLRKWLRRYRDAGEEGLRSQSRRPHNSPNRKISETDRATILRLRSEHKGARRIQSELQLHEQRELSLATIYKVLCEASVKPLVRQLVSSFSRSSNLSVIRAGTGSVIGDGGLFRVQISGLIE
jgi:transposase